ncbi:MAG: hypothetical protein PUE01_14565 [Clostridiaceae bacterium]|nr:hypothetical protein [Clostridiaceae bacterium]
MEFIVNRIDTRIRNEIKDKTREGKVHNTKPITVKRDLDDEEKPKSKHKKEEQNKKEAKYITIDGIKYNSEKMDVNVHREENLREENSRGRIIDTKK